MNLLTSSKDTLLTLPQLIHLPSPQVLSRRHRPILHGELATMVIREAQHLGLQVTQQHHAISNDGGKYFGLLEIGHDPQHRTIIGIRNSHDMTLGAGLVCGKGVMVCSNLDFLGEIRISIRHVGNVKDRLVESVQQSLPQVIDMEKVQDGRIAHYQRTPIHNERDIYPALIGAIDAKVIPSSHIGKVLEEWRQPSFEAFRGERNLYRLWNAFTTVMRPSSMGRLWGLPERGAGLHRVLEGVGQ